MVVPLIFGGLAGIGAAGIGAGLLGAASYTASYLAGNDDETLSQSEYDFRQRVFPNDLGMDYLGHYMVININVPVIPNSGTARGNLTGPNFRTSVLPGEFSKVDVLRFGPNASLGGNSGTGIPRRTRRIKESIALFMPGSQIIYNGKNAYEEISLTAIGGTIVTGALAAGYGIFKKGLAAITGGSASGQRTISGAGSFLNTAGNVIGTTAQLANMPINPRIEVLFATTPLRDFQFEFLMIPRNEEESRIIKEIVTTLRFHAAPELSLAGFTFIPPAEFDITFYHAGVENLAIPRINTCVLLECEVDYAPNLGIWQTYKDGSPLATRLRLVFKEVEPVHKLRISQGF